MQALWRASAGWDTTWDGCMRGGCCRYLYTMRHTLVSPSAASGRETGSVAGWRQYTPSAPFRRLQLGYCRPPYGTHDYGMHESRGLAAGTHVRWIVSSTICNGHARCARCCSDIDPELAVGTHAGVGRSSSICNGCSGHHSELAPRVVTRGQSRP